MINNDYDYDDVEEDLVIQAAAATGIAAGLCAMQYAQTHYDMEHLPDEVKESLDMISTTLQELASQRRFSRLQLDARDPAAQRRREAVERVQQIETHLDTSRMIALADLVAQDTIAADTYMVLKRESLRRAWVALRLKEMDFVDGISI